MSKGMRVKDIEQELIKMINEHGNHDYKTNAFRELDKVEEGGFLCPHCAFIVNQYPDFNSICLKLEQPDHYLMMFYVNIADLKNKDKKTAKAIHKLAKMLYGWYKQGAKRTER